MKILILEDNDIRIKFFKRRFIYDDLTVVNHAKEAIDLIKENEYDLIMLDHDLGDKQMEWDEDDNGMMVAEYLNKNPVDAKVIIHSFNNVRGPQMQKLILGSTYRPGFGLEEMLINIKEKER